MKPNLIFINTARGEVVDQMALTKALKDKKIFGAGLDVTSPEPLDCRHDLFKMENVIITPHIASATFKAREDMSVLCAKNIIEAFK
jgi:phosphoglycerate dehydrogenase-like enzyme